MSMNCIIVDDEYKGIELLKGYIEEIPFLNLINTFRNPIEAIGCIQQHNIDLVFLDINMPRLSGLQVARTLTTKPIIIFTTAYAQHAVEGFELDVADYLLKPITFERFLKAAHKARVLSQGSNSPTANPINEFILIKSGPQLHQIKRSDILFIEKDGNYTTFHTCSGKIVTRHNFAEALELTGTMGMARIHKSFVVALQHISLIEAHEVTIHKTKIPIGASYRTEFLKLLEKKQD